MCQRAGRVPARATSAYVTSEGSEVRAVMSSIMLRRRERSPIIAGRADLVEVKSEEFREGVG